MSDQLSFGSVLQAPSRPVATSREAAKKITPHLREILVGLLRVVNTLGAMTADEIAGTLGKHVLSVRPRVSDAIQQGWLRPTGHERPSLLGNPQAEVDITETGREQIA